MTSDQIFIAVRGMVVFAAVGVASAAFAQNDGPVPRVAAIVTAYYENSHADLIVSRLLQSQTLDGRGEYPRLRLASLYTDQVPDNDISRRLSREYGFPIYDNVAHALTLGGEQLAVDGVLLIAEHGQYPESPTGQFVFPKRRLFAEIVAVMEKSQRSVPVFCDKQLADNWEDAKWLYDTASRLKIPLMAGSSLPVLWRYPPVDIDSRRPLREIVATSYHRLDSYGFHALEVVQTLAEHRLGGETGVSAVQCLEGAAVWEAGQRGVYDRRLLAEALRRLKEQPLPNGKPIEELVERPTLFLIEYKDGLRASIFTLNYAVAEWAAAWSYADASDSTAVMSTLFWTQEQRPFAHFSHLVAGVERMMHTGQPTWPAERTLVTSGLLDALLISRHTGGQRRATPQLEISYRSQWQWNQPPPPPVTRPIGK